MPSPAVEDGFKIAVLLPCRNVAGTIGAAVAGFAEALPAARIYVFDNNSTDDTAREAARAGAHVLREPSAGKESVVRRMFADIDADIYVMADGDGSYDPADAPSLVNALITERVDMVVGNRRDVAPASRPGASGAVARLNRLLLGAAVGDSRSGYRAFSRRFVKSFPAIPIGFDIDTEMSVHARQLMIPVAEIDLNFRRNAESSTKPQKNAPPGSIVLARLLREMQPFPFYAAFALLFWIAGLLLAAPLVATWIEAGRVAQPGTAIVAMGLFLIGFMLAGCGLILDSVGRSRIEQKRILFLSVPALGSQ